MLHACNPWRLRGGRLQPVFRPSGRPRAYRGDHVHSTTSEEEMRRIHKGRTLKLSVLRVQPCRNGTLHATVLQLGIPTPSRAPCLPGQNRSRAGGYMMTSVERPSWS